MRLVFKIFFNFVKTDSIELLNFLLLLTMLLTPMSIMAVSYVFPHQDTYSDDISIEDLNQKQNFYSELRGFPQNYTFTFSATSSLNVSMLLPQKYKTPDDFNVIIVKRVARGRVEEVVRLNSIASEWTQYNDRLAAEKFNQKQIFLGDLPPGSYLLEVSTPENLGKYVLSFGIYDNENLLTKLSHEFKRVYDIKLFLGKPIMSVLQSPLYYVTLIIVFAVVIAAFPRKILYS